MADDVKEELIEELELDLEQSEDPPLGEKGKSALDKERQARKEAERKAKELVRKLEAHKEVDIEEYRSLKEAKDRTDKEKLLQEQKYKELSVKLDREMKEKTALIDTLQKERLEQLKQKEAAIAFYSCGGREGSLSKSNYSSFDVIYSQIQNRLELNDDGSISVLTPDGQVEDRDEQNNPKTLRQLIEEYREDPVWGNFFEKKPVSGGGLTQGVRNGKVKETWDEHMKKQGIIR